MKLICKKCKEEAKKVIISRYEYQKSIVLEDVEAYECPKCHEFIFTEKQIENIEKKVEVIKFHKFSFERKLTISGRSLVINIPEDVVRHMNLAKGKTTKLTPLDDKHFIVEVE
ncbi:MAG TPA: YgiT-type zinc finger protein [archaeon]|nr:YgiT-type zinc finger protein [archaeon]